MQDIPASKILWLLQSNQVTQPIHNFFHLLRARMEKLVTLSFIIPDSSEDILTKLKDLSPSKVSIHGRSATNSHPGYLTKKNALGEAEFADGLSIADALLLDDLGGGGVVQTSLQFEPDPGTCCLFLQIPTPLGSSESEERIFHAAVLWARQHRIPSIGYELLPLDTRWTLSASLPDAVVTKTRESYDHLRAVFHDRNIWLLPSYEGAIFSTFSNEFTLNGIKAAYHFRSIHKIPERRTIVYIPHNVAMIYEYQDLLRIMAYRGNDLHLMFSYGKDQIRGAYSQQETIELVYAEELKSFASYSFHDMNAPWEMMMADSLVACSACYHTSMGHEKNIPILIYDPTLPPASNGLKQRVNKPAQVKRAIGNIMEEKKTRTELGTVFMQIARSMAEHD